MDLGRANRFSGRVIAVAYQGSNAQVTIDCGGREIVSVLPRSVVEGMQVQPGEKIVALVNCEDVALLRGASS